jgi:ubiquinol-cytochrome c reductase cytochrome c1 subunit
MMHAKGILTAFVLVGGMLMGTAQAAESGGKEAELQSWSFSGVFGKYDPQQLQRGFQVFREVCASCHSANLLAFRNLAEEGGPEFDEAQVKLLAAEYTVVDPDALDGERPAVPADRWPAPFETEQDARDSNNGAVPPDFSVLAKARGIHQKFPFWAFNYFTGYQEGGPDYIYNLLVNYAEAPHGVELGEGQAYNAYLGSGLSMLPPLDDGLVTYEGEGTAVPETVEQYAHDVSAFMMWVAEPHLTSRKQMGFRALTFLIILAGMMYLVKRKLWADIKH